MLLQGMHQGYADCIGAETAAAIFYKTYNVLGPIGLLPSLSRFRHRPPPALGVLGGLFLRLLIGLGPGPQL